MDPNQQQSQQQQQPTPPTPTLPQSQQSQPPLNIIISLENCILPESKFTCTPSSLDGLDSQYEYELRILGTELVQTSGILLKLPQVAMATGQVLFQRFYYSKSFVRHKMEMTAMACILLASKIEEAPRRIRDVVNVFNHMRQVRAGLTPQPILLDQNYINLKAKIIRAERQLLKELGFCVHVKHPHKFIVTLLQVLDLKGNKQLMQTSWNYMNDSLRTDVFLRWLPETIACACIYLSANLLRIPLPSNPAWYELFDASEADLESICTTILKLYTQKKPDQAKLEGIVDSLRKQWENSQKNIEKKNEPGGSGTLGDIKNGEIENSETIRDDEKTNEPDLQVTTNSPKANKDVFERLKKRSPSYESSSSPKYEVNKDRSTLKTRDNISRYRDSYDNSKSRRSPSRDNNTNSHSKSYSRSKERSKDYDEFKSHKKHKEDKDYYYSSSKDHYSSKESKYYVKEKSRKHSRHSNRDRDAH